jgi:uncharacterized ion transporter superfamily protein YfcC
MRAANERFPGLIEEVLSLRREIHPSPPSKIFSDHVKNMKKEKEKIQSTSHRIPLWVLVVLIVMAYIYSRTASLISTGYLVPTVNISFFVIGIVFLFARQTKYYEKSWA